ncbi:hypothetical protein JCM11491_006298 [Sporobolomyces phaffii]
MNRDRYSASTLDPNKPLSLLLLGTGASSAVPLVSCVTDLETACASCRDTTSQGAGAVSKNKRGNTGAVLRIPQMDGSEATILIDCGKTFREQALRFFPGKGLRKVDACILTHHHADATGGLDDLRAWTDNAAIQRTIPIFCTRTTFEFVSAEFPYLVDKTAASGGGKLPSIEWHIMPEDKDWKICGITITPLPVHHGVYFDKTPHEPLICLGFLFDSSLLYMSDVSFIPEKIWALLSRKLSLPSRTGSYPTKPLPRLQALVIDVTGLRQGRSHFGLPQAIETSRRVGARKTYFTGICHQHSHAAFLSFSLAFEQHDCSIEAQYQGVDDQDPPPLWRVRNEGQGDRESPPFGYVYEGINFRVDDLGVWRERALEAVEGWAGGVLPGSWTRPGVDGMTIQTMRGLSRDTDAWSRGRVWDDEYGL